MEQRPTSPSAEEEEKEEVPPHPPPPPPSLLLINNSSLSRARLVCRAGRPFRLRRPRPFMIPELEICNSFTDGGQFAFKM